MQTKSKYISNYKKNHPVVETSGSGTGTYKWVKYLDGIDMRFGHKTRRAAEIARARVADESYAYYAHKNELIKCPKCGKLEKRETMEITGECNDCMLKN